MQQSGKRVVKRWQSWEEKFLFENIHTMALEDICKRLDRNKRSVNLYLHRHRNDPRLIIKDNLLLLILRLKFSDPELFNPTRTFLDAVKIGQKRFHSIYKGKERMTDEECMRICGFFSIPYTEVMEIRQTDLFSNEEQTTDDIKEVPAYKPEAVQLNFLKE